jgi:hypothetical protein
MLAQRGAVIQPAGAVIQPAGAAWSVRFGGGVRVA